MKFPTLFFKNILYDYSSTRLKVTQNFLYLITAQIIYKILAFLTFIFIARHLGVEVFGQMSYVLSFIAFFALITDFGINGVLIREMAGEMPEKRLKYINNVATLKFILSLVTLAGIILISLILKEKREIVVLSVIFGLAMIFDSYTIFFKSIFRVFERMKYESIAIIFEGTLKFLLIFAIMKTMPFTVLLVSKVFLLISISTFCLTLFIIKAKFVSLSLYLDLKIWKKLFIQGIPFSIFIFFYIINFRIDTIMLSKMVDNVATGLFNVATRIIEPVLIIPSTFVAAVFPAISRLSRKSEESVFLMYKTSVKALTLISALFVIILFLGAGFYVPFLFGEEFMKSVLGIRIMSFVLMPLFLRFFLDSFILALNKANIIFYNYIIGTLCNIILNIILIPKFNFYGACIATLFSEFVMVGFYLFWLKNNLPQAVKTRILTQR